MHVYEQQQNLGWGLWPCKTSLSPQLFITDCSKAVLLLLVVLFVSILTLSVCLWHFIHFINDILVDICWERAVLLAFRLFCFYFMPSLLYMFLSRLVSGRGCRIGLYCFLSIAFSFASQQYLSPVKRICVFEHSVMTNFNCACPAIQRGQGSGFLSERSSWLTACMSEQRRFWRDCADAQARLNLRCSHMR